MKVLIFGAGQDSKFLNLYGNCIVLSRECCNISNYKLVSEIIDSQKPNVIYHLAAKSTTKHHTIFDNHRAITTGTLNVLEAIKNYSPGTKVFITGSGLQFKNEGKPINEKCQFEAHDPYTAARIYSVHLARYYRSSFNIKTYVGYLFHHESQYRQGISISKIILNAARRIHSGSKEKLEVGDLSVFKEWSFAGDIVAGMKTLLEQDDVTEATIGSGIGYTIEDWIKLCFSFYNLNYLDHIKIINGFKPDYKYLISDPTTINNLGWKCKVGLAELLRLMVSSI